MTNQIGIDLQELERRIADCDRRINQTEMVLVKKRAVLDALENIPIQSETPGRDELVPTVALFKLALHEDIVVTIAYLESVLAELRNTLATMRAIKFGVVA